MWKRLKHRNIVPLLGITSNPLQLISEWMPGGNLTEYIKKYPRADRLSLASIPAVVFDPTLTPATSYLMSLGVFTFSTSAIWSTAISKGYAVEIGCLATGLTRAQPNILVDDAGHARITDFGLATVTQNLDSMRTTSEDHGHTARWTAPEILTEEGTYSKEADIFSFAMVMIEV